MESARSTRTIAGAGREIIAADQPARMPPQASMARSDTIPQAGATAGRAAGSSSAGDRSSAQTSPASVAAVVSGDAVQLAVESPPVSAQQHVASATGVGAGAGAGAGVAARRFSA